jgi:3-isopropylmalate dehydrogenase
MESGVFWREIVTKLHQAEYSDVTLNHMYADNCAMQLVRNPGQFDVIVTDNLFGDILSDCAAMLTGSLGMLPSASLGSRDPKTGKIPAMYEPVHGSAPDIAGQGKANPLATILSYSMMLRYSFDMGAEADRLDRAVQNVLAKNLRTADIMTAGCTLVSTQGMGEAVIKEMEALG